MKVLKLVIVFLAIIIVIFACAFKVYIINGRFYIENRWIHDYEFSSEKAQNHNTVIIVDSNCYSAGNIKISGYIDNELLFSNDFVIGGGKNTDIKAYRNLSLGEHDLVIKTENGIEANGKIEIGKGQKWIYITYEEDKNSQAQISIKIIDRPFIILR